MGRWHAEVQQPRDQAGLGLLPEDRLHRGQRPRRHQGHRGDELPDRWQRPVRHPPACHLFKQATFIAGKGGFPDTVLAKADTEIGVVAFPAKEAGNNPVLTGGDLATAFNNDANTLKLRNFIASKDNGVEVGKAGYFSPHKSFDVTLYPSKMLQKIASDVLYKSSAARFDGSDLMPAKVGAGTFWTEPIKWISGTQDLDVTLNNIDASWPKAAS